MTTMGRVEKPTHGEPGVVAVFAKPPRAGEVKTRLAAELGPGVAATMAKAFFHDTWRALKAFPRARLVLASTDEELSPYGLTEAELWLQGDGDLGARMERIATRALATAPWVLEVGSDCPGLPLAALEDAREALLRHDAVLGPAEDGGFYLLGFRKEAAGRVTGLLGGLPWSAPTTFAETRSRLLDRGLSVATTRRWSDVDDLEDLVRLTRALHAGTLAAPFTASALDSLRIE